ncbi:probable serine/threonine-protein kinase PBL18 [Solanum stenotomum]|uniref:probable serine/threonine-protein kinase PBL18 n=1 Tax=Solanum stenotomum TaxID=172797 RepID=UPI0020D0CA7A|nr:probable serine/threonine-protein kinase PBL18 [Solanum stenotomum]
MDMTTDGEMRDEEEKKSVSIEAIRKKFTEWGFSPYAFQMYNLDEGSLVLPSFPHPLNKRPNPDLYMNYFLKECKRYESFDFSIEPMIVGEVKHCSYSELDKMTNYKNRGEIQKTLTGRLFHGTIVEGTVTRPAIVKTWDYLFPMKPECAPRLYKFCDEIKLLTDERANKHPNLVKLYRYCFDTRLAVVYDAKFTGVLSNVLLADDFGWDDRMKVATQLADLFSWLHEKGIAFGYVSDSCIMIDEEVNIKVFDFGFVSNNVNEDTEIPVEVRVGWEGPDIQNGKRTMKTDVYIFGILLLKLIAKNAFICAGPYQLDLCAIDEAKLGKKYLVHECFKEVDYSNAFEITRLAFLCLNPDHPDKRPTMKDVVYALKMMQRGVKKRKRDENEAE